MGGTHYGSCEVRVERGRRGTPLAVADPHIGASRCACVLPVQWPAADAHWAARESGVREWGLYVRP